MKEFKTYRSIAPQSPLKEEILSEYCRRRGVRRKVTVSLCSCACAALLLFGAFFVPFQGKIYRIPYSARTPFVSSSDACFLNFKPSDLLFSEVISVVSDDCFIDWDGETVFMYPETPVFHLEAQLKKKTVHFEINVKQTFMEIAIMNIE